MLNHYPLLGQLPILSPLLGTQGSSWGLFVRGATIAVELAQSLVPLVSQTLQAGVKSDATALEEAEVMGSAFAMSTTDDLPCCLINH